ncbi:DUF1697 domain-containing protein [Lacisediminihabitans sp. FW035]
MPRYVALLRGINVGRAKAIPMADLASVFTTLGFTEVATVLRSGNVVFESRTAVSRDAAERIEAGVLAATGVQSSVLLRDSQSFSDILDANPLVDIATDGSKSFVTFVTSMPTGLELPDADILAPERLAVGPAAVYQWMPEGSLQTRVPKAFWRQFDAPVTARNWNTVQKLRALLDR